MKITLTKDGMKNVKHGKVKFTFHDFYLSVGEYTAERTITLVRAYELGILSAWCITGLKGLYKQSVKANIKNRAIELADSEEASLSWDYEEK